MKLLLLTTDINIVGGIENVISKLTNFFVEKYDYEIEIISLYGNSQIKPHFDFNPRIKLSYANLKPPIRKSKFHEITKDLKLKNQIYNIIKDKYFDIIMTFHYCISLPLILNRKHIKGKIVVTEHSDYYHGIGRLDILKRKLLYNKADKVIVLTQNNKKIYEQFLSNVDVINNPRPFTTRNISKQVKKRVITAGRQEYEKGFDRIIDIFNDTEIKNSEWVLDIYGEGSEMKNLKNKIKKYDLEDKVRILPFSNRIDEEFLESSIYVLPSRTEAFPMVLLEAMECGLPCISFNLPGPSEIIKSNEDGFIIENGDINEFREKLKILMNNDELRKSYSKRAKDNVQRFDITKIADMWKQLYSII